MEEEKVQQNQQQSNSCFQNCQKNNHEQFELKFIDTKNLNLVCESCIQQILSLNSEIPQNNFMDIPSFITHIQNSQTNLKIENQQNQQPQNVYISEELKKIQKEFKIISEKCSSFADFIGDLNFKIQSEKHQKLAQIQNSLYKFDEQLDINNLLQELKENVFYNQTYNLELKSNYNYILTYIQDINKEIQNIQAQVNLVNLSESPEQKYQEQIQQINNNNNFNFSIADFGRKELLNFNKEKNSFKGGKVQNQYIYSNQGFKRGDKATIFVKLEEICQNGIFYIGLIPSFQIGFNPWIQKPNFAVNIGSCSKFKRNIDFENLFSYQSANEEVIFKITLDFSEGEVFEVEANCQSIYHGQNGVISLDLEGQSFVREILFLQDQDLRLCFSWDRSEQEIFILN